METKSQSKDKIYDYIVVGSGFGGAVAAMRLAEKGYSVLVLEQGRKYQARDFAKNNWQVHRYLWIPFLRLFGIMRISFFNEALVLSGVGVGGGSLVYANTHVTPSDEFFLNPAWRHFKDWKSTLAPFYALAKKMLGTTPYPHHFREDEALLQVAKKMNCEDSFSAVEVGVYFGDSTQAVDPYFAGAGPLRKGCILCAGCMVGCRFEAKNTLDKNYLYFAQKNGARICADQQAEKVEFAKDIYLVHCLRPSAWISKKKTTYRSRGIVFSAGVLGTLNLLFKQKYKYKTLSNLSDVLGKNLRTNSESLCGVGGAKEKLNHGIAISSIIHPDDHTHVEICKYPDGSGLLSRLAVMAAGDGPPPVRILKSFFNTVLHPVAFFKLLFDFSFAKNSVYLLIMQSLDNAMSMIYKKGLFGWQMRMKNTTANRVPSYIPIGQKVLYEYAKEVGGVPLNAVTEVTMNLSSTAHILGGCAMGETSAQGMVNEKFAVFNYPRMLILDGSIIPCNLGVNPSLTITALAEYAMNEIPSAPST
jgi:cholesterol oxidase